MVLQCIATRYIGSGSLTAAQVASARGNPLLVDSTLTNAEARYEWYFAPEQRFSIAGFYKQITRPIEAPPTISATARR